VKAAESTTAAFASVGFYTLMWFRPPGERLAHAFDNSYVSLCGVQSCVPWEPPPSFAIARIPRCPECAYAAMGRPSEP